MGRNEVRLEEVCAHITDGKHGDCENEANSGFFFLSCKDVSDGTLHYEDARQITELDFRETHRRTRLEPWDILITNSGTIGRMALAPANDLTTRTTFQKSVAILKPIKEKIDSRFLYYTLQAERDRLIAFAGGTAQKNLLLRDLRAFTVEVPPVLIQCRIASILSTYDDLIENNARRITILEEMAQMLYREWFVYFRFPGHEKVRMVESDLGPVPEEWESRRLEDAAKVNELSIKSSSAPERIRYIDIASVSTARIEKIESLNFEDAPGRARRIVRHGDIIWSTVRPNRRSYALIVTPEPNLIVSTGFAVVTAKTVPFSYLYLAVTTDEFANYLTNHATGSAYPAVTGKEFEQAQLVVPPASLRNRFHEIAEPMLSLSWCLNQRNVNLRTTRDLFLPKLISGEIPVEAAEDTAAEAMEQTA